MFALVGFVHQMLGTAADYVRYVSGLETSGVARFESIIIETETSGQDSEMRGITTTGDSVRILSQYKFSLTPDAHQIYPKELGQIAETLKASARRRQPHKQLRPVRPCLVLRSNRRLSKGAQSRLHTLGIKYKRYNPTEARSTLDAYASLFGVYGPENLDNGVRNVIGQLVRIAQGPEPRTIKKGEFDQALTSLANPHSIAISGAVNRLQRELDDQRSTCLELEGSVLVFRKSVENAMKEWDYDALIVVTGNGGCGKTTALWQVLRAAVSEDAVPRRLASLITASDIPSGFGGLIERWRGGTASDVSNEIGLEMLSRANKGTKPPVLMLGLDGIGEIDRSGPLWQKARGLIELFWQLHRQHKKINEPPPARLIVTCRDRQDLDRFIDPVTGLRSKEEPSHLSLDEFTDPELLELLQSEDSVDDGPAKRLREALETKLSARDEGVFTTGSIAYDHEAAACLPLIRHPILWHCFSRLPQLHKRGVIQGSDEALGEFAKEYFSWFRRRAHRRRGFKDFEVNASLHLLAAKYASVADVHSALEWRGCVNEATGFSSSRAEEFYSEAISSSLINALSPTSWRWRHAFLVNHLRVHEG